ncbi:MAG: tRNA adenosine(34) deaminase TadA [Lachnospiraceae bacterium]|jgi:tRNA(adenine34) deaminase|nr:tRNA adenosine(34) deaminase TadA [Lachnospiraceae bacterium]
MEKPGIVEIDEYFMREALKQAKRAAAMGDTPIGCVIVRDRGCALGGMPEIIARGYNRRNKDKNVLSHAELIALKKACKAVGDWRLEDCTMYVTLEPCPMCAGALVQSRIKRVVMGCKNPKAGCAGSVLDLLHQDGFNHRVETGEGVLEEECGALLQDFFRAVRRRGKDEGTADSEPDDLLRQVCSEGTRPHMMRL